MPTWLAWFAVAFTLAATQSQVPAFRTSTDVVIVDVQVTSGSGDVISDLTQADFMLKVDGKPRPILTFIHERIDDARPAKRAGVGAMSTLSSGIRIDAQSYVMVVVDPWMMRPEASRNLLDQAADFVEKLPAAHAVGLTLLPARRPQYPFTTNRAPIVAALRKQLGALGAGTTPTTSEGQAAIDGIEAAIDDLRDVDGRKTMVFIADVMTDPSGRLRQIATRAADANITIHTISTDATVASLVDVKKRTPTDLPGLADTGSGSMLSDLTGGWSLRRATNGSLVMSRIEKMLAEQYVLTFALTADDRDGKSHQIEVSVNRPGAQVRARSSFVR